MAKIYLQDIKDILSKEGWSIISDSYKSLDTEMQFECPYGHTVISSWKRIRTKLECPICRQRQEIIRTDQIFAKPKGAQRILALDQATHITGFAVFDDGKLVKFGTFEAKGSGELERLISVRDWFTSMICTLKPDYIGIEGVQYQEESSGKKMGVTVFQALARLQGVLQIVGYDNQVPIDICPTNSWRHACGVKGRTRADRKHSMRELVKQWYDVKVNEDEADAIGIGRYLVEKQKSQQIQMWAT